MPIYEYTCRDDGFAFEFLVQGNRAAFCPQCGGDNLEKRWSTFAASTSGTASTPDNCAMPSGGHGAGCGCCGGGSSGGTCALN